MNEEKKLLSADEADKLLACADGTAALLFLHILRRGEFSLSAAARELQRSEAETALAADKLRRLGLLERVQSPLQSRETPEYTAQDIVGRAAADTAFTDVVKEAEKALGRVLSSNDLRLLFGIYDHLGLPADVIMLLIHHCIEEYQERNGAGRLPAVRYIEKEGWHWAEREILTLDAAEEHIRREKEKRSEAERLKAMFQIRDRAFTASERRYIDEWLALGFSADALAVAYDRTVLNTGKLAWKYMDSIVRSWAERKLFTPAEIEAGDPRRAAAKPIGAEPVRSDSDKLRSMEKMLRHLQTKSGGREG